jgi:hypothetical protein
VQPSAADAQEGGRGATAVESSRVGSGYARVGLTAVSLIGALAVVMQVFFVKKAKSKGRHKQ